VTSQALIFYGGISASGPMYVGSNKSSVGYANSISLQTPSATQVGDLVLVFASGSDYSDNGFTWSCTNRPVTEIKDANSAPNLYFAYHIATKAGAISYSLSASDSGYLRAMTVVYRNAKYEKFTYASRNSPSSVNLSITTDSLPANIVGFAASLRSSINWSVTNTDKKIFVKDSGYPVTLGFIQNDTSATFQDFDISGMNGSKFEGIIVSVIPVAYVPPVPPTPSESDYWASWTTQSYGWEELVYTDWWAS